MANKSTYLDNKLLDQTFRGTAFTFPTTLYLAAYTAAPTAAGGGTEVTGGSYARVPIVCNATNWAAASGGANSNAVAFTFPQATADWGNVVALGFFDAPIVGNLLWWAVLAIPPGSSTGAKTIQNQDTLSFAPGAITITDG